MPLIYMDAAKYTIMHRKVSTMKNYSTQYINSAETEKPLSSIKNSQFPGLSLLLFFEIVSINVVQAGHEFPTLCISLQATGYHVGTTLLRFLPLCFYLVLIPQNK